ncbi:MAG: NifU family protein, partial [Acidobacteriota bacterium]
FAMHGLVKADLATRVAQVLDATRPYLQSHGGDVELVAIEGSAVKVRLTGSCTGCSMSSVTLRTSVEEALTTRIPEIDSVEEVKDRVEPAFVPLEALKAPKGERHGWRQGPSLHELTPAKPYRLDVDEKSVVLIRLENRVQAFRNECAHQGLPIDGGRIDEDGTLTCPWHGFRFDAISGECMTSPAAQLEPLPLRIEDGVVWVRPS